MNTPRARFRPPPWAVALTAFGLILFAALGVWQLQRAAEKRAFFAAFDAPAPSALPLGAPDEATAAAHRFSYVRLQGRYDGARQVLLDASERNGRNGYEVLTPLLTVNGAVLVNRGWVAAPTSRGLLPDVSVAGGERQVTGRLNRLPTPGLRTGAAPSTAGGWPRRLLYPRAAEIAAALGYAVRDYQVLLAPGEPDGYLRDWRPAVMRPEQHVGYAVQWFALALTVIIVFVIRNLKRT